MTELATKRKEEFIKRKKGLRSEADITAQQLTNIYRQLAVLGDEATQRYNQQLIREVNPDVLMALRTIPGGEEVRDYYSFLTHTEIDENDPSYLQTEEGSINSLLPSPEQMSPIWESFGMSGFGAGGTPQRPISMAVVNPIKASVVTTNLSSNKEDINDNIVLSHGNIDFKELQENLEQAFEKQKNDIMQALNFIVIDSNIEKMHQNLKNAIVRISEAMDSLKNKITEEILTTKEKSFFPVYEERLENITKNETKKQEEIKTQQVNLDKFRKVKSGPKFSVDITEEDNIF